MKAALLQMEILLGQTRENQRKARRLIGEAMREGPDVIVLPELWNTGFFPADIARHADEDGRETRQLLGELAKEYAVHIVGGSAAVRRGGRVYNTSYIFDRAGRAVSSYEKAHLFSPAGEDEAFQAGRRLCTFSIDGIKAAVAICYDIRFCEWIRLLALDGVSVLFVPAAWPRPRNDHWRTLLKARAIENQMFVVGVNGAGRANDLEFFGGSMILDPWGEVLAAGGDGEMILTGTLDCSAISLIKENMDVFKDRRSDIYTLKAADPGAGVGG